MCIQCPLLTYFQKKRRNNPEKSTKPCSIQKHRCRIKWVSKWYPVLGIPVESKKLKGLDSLLSIVQMPKGIPVGTLAIGEDGAINAALLAASILANSNPVIKRKLKNWRLSQTKSVKKNPK